MDAAFTLLDHGIDAVAGLDLATDQIGPALLGLQQRMDRLTVLHARWMAAGLIAKVSDLQAQTWSAAGAALWAAVVHPFILVQPERRPPGKMQLH